jgi:hypothetical protein
MLLKPQTPEDPEGTPSAINKRLAIRLHTMQHELQTLQHEHKLLYSDLCAIAKALGVEPEGFGITGAGIAPITILERIEELKRHASYY